MQPVSVQPSTDNALCPTGRLSSRSWLAWLTRTHLAPRPWPRGKHPVWISSSSCWLGPTQIWVKHTHPTSLHFAFNVCCDMRCLAVAFTVLRCCRHVALLIFDALSLFFFLFPCSVLLLALTSASCTALLTMLWVDKSSSHLDVQITREKKSHQQQKQMTGLCSKRTTGLYCLSNPRDCLLALPPQWPWSPCRPPSLELTLCPAKLLTLTWHQPVEE